MLYIGIGDFFVAGGCMGLCLSNAIFGKAISILKQARDEEGWRKTALKLSG